MKIAHSLLFPAPEGRAIFRTETCYTSENGMVQELSELVASDTFGDSLRRISRDGGHTWSEPQRIATPKETPAGVERTGESALMFDANRQRLLRFFNTHLYPESKYTKAVTRNTAIQYEISCDGGASFSAPRQIIVEGGTATDWAPGVRYGENSMMISFSAPFVDAKGRIILPAQLFREVPEEANTYRLPLEAGCFIGEWTADGGLSWIASQTVTVDPALSARGIFEPAIAPLSDGRFLMLCRGSNAGLEEVPGRRWMSISDDAVEWSTPVPFGYDDGTLFFSPSTGSRLIRYSRNGKLYWIGNITPENPKGNSPRQPLQVAEVDEARLALVRGSLRLIDERRADDPETLQLSNFRVYEDRATGEIVVTLARLVSMAADKITTPATQYRFRPE